VPVLAFGFIDRIFTGSVKQAPPPDVAQPSRRSTASLDLGHGHDPDAGSASAKLVRSDQNHRFVTVFKTPHFIQRRKAGNRQAAAIDASYLVPLYSPRS